MFISIAEDGEGPAGSEQRLFLLEKNFLWHSLM